MSREHKPAFEVPAPCLRYTPPLCRRANCESTLPTQSSSGSLGDLFTIWRLPVVVIIYFAIAYPQSKSTLTVDFCLGVFLLAVLANVAYCAAYVVDIFAQASGFREVWQRSRKLLFVIGTLFAAIITRFVAMGMFPSGR